MANLNQSYNDQKSNTKKKIQTVITKVADNRFKAQRGRIIITFMIDDKFNTTTFDGIKSDTVKSYHFVGSDPFRMWMVAKTLKDIATFVMRMKREAEEK